ncbi:hypothetical protein BX600DRAFT_512667 [Xylariales sp. PMI_506]|nr:hypothetical protein BX600DRAFT_512667 [Xylariales sp. PMI_506]
MGSSNAQSGPRFPYHTLGISVVVYFVALITSAVASTISQELYNEPCDFGDCSTALQTIWRLTIACSVVTFVVSIIQFIVHERGHQSKGRLTMVFLAINAILWLSPIVLGWLPPPWTNSADGSTTYYETDNKPPSVGMFHYVLSWYRASKTIYKFSASYDTTSASSVLVAVILCNLAFAWSVLVIIIVIVQLYRQRVAAAKQRNDLATKE